MLPFEKTKDHLICIDSDGTIMDTMTIKHERCFGPMFLVAFDIVDNIDDILREWNDINLYSLKRGINRFQGLKEILTYIRKYGYDFEGEEEFFEWVDTTNEFSARLLSEINKDNHNDCIRRALAWSKLVNDEITRLPPSNAFDGVKEILEKASLEADLVGVSSANKDAVNEEWTRLNIKNLFRFVACQDVGTKARIIESTLENGYKKSNTIMLGDALGDLKAATDNGVWFFPIIPSKETYSWKKFLEEGLVKFLNDEFDSEYQKEVIDEFKASLK